MDLRELTRVINVILFFASISFLIILIVFGFQLVMPSQITVLKSVVDLIDKQILVLQHFIQLLPNFMSDLWGVIY